MYDTEPVETLRYHHEMLIDKVRVESYQQAILQVVQKGDVVLDLGCGTGILSLFACRAGARRVYAVEAEPVIEIAKRVIEDNGYTDRIIFMNDWSTYVELPEKVDVIVTETIGNLGFEEGILDWVADARKRFLKKGGRVIPQEVELFLAPVRYDPDRDRTSAWVEDFYGLDFSSVRDIAVNQVFPIRLDQADLLGPGAPMLKVDLMEEVKGFYQGRNSIQIESNGVLQGLGGWFRSLLVDDVSITNAPPNQIPSWWHVFFPLEAPLDVQEGDYLLLEASINPSGGEWSWKVKRQTDAPNPGDDGVDWDFEHQMEDGEIMPIRELRDYDIKPTLDSDAILDLHLLQAMDGNHSIREIAEDVTQKFPGTFRNQETAREHVYSFYEDYGVRQE